MIMRINNDCRVTIPASIRKKLNIEKGQEFYVTTDGKNIILAPIEQVRLCPVCYNFMNGNICEYCKTHK